MKQEIIQDFYVAGLVGGRESLGGLGKKWVELWRID
jgi:hypothetical protein